MSALEVDVPAVEQGPDDLYRLGEHALALVRVGPAFPDDMLVEVLPGAETEGEPVTAQHGPGRRLLGPHGRVIPHGRAGDVRHQLGPPGRLSHRAQRYPGIGRVTLLVQPREVVV